MEIKRIASLIMASALVATSVFYDVSPVYASQDKGGIVDDGLVETSEGSLAAENAINAEDGLTAETAGSLSAADAAGEIVDAVPTQETFTDAGAIIDVPGLGNSGIVDDITVSGDEVEADGIKSNDEEISNDTVEEIKVHVDNEFTLGDFRYGIDDIDSVAKVISWTGTGIARIPEEITLPRDVYPSKRINDDYKRKVVEIDKNAFAEENGHKLSEVVIPDTVQNIREQAFKDCTSLASVSFPSRMYIIESRAFEGCSSLSDVKLPDKLEKFGSSVFSGCSNLTTITIPKDMDINGLNNTTTSVAGPFAGADNLKTIVFETGIKKLTNNLFNSCNALEQIALPDTMTTVGAFAFANCSNLATVTMTNTMTDIGTGAFQNCTSLRRIELSKYLKTLGDKAFNGCTLLISATIPDSIKTLGVEAFSGCSVLESVSFTEGDKGSYEGGSIGDKAFSGCNSLRTIIIPNSISSIGKSAFAGLASLTEMRIENRFKNMTFEITIGESAFANCLNLYKITLDEDARVIKIGTKAFSQCESLSVVSLSKYLTHIGSEAFSSCLTLDTIDMPNSVKEIGSSAFQSCASLRYVTLSTGLETIGDYVFRNDNSLIEILLPKSIEKAGRGAFKDCERFKKVRFEIGIRKIANNLLSEANYIEDIEINDTVTDIGDNAFDGCVMLTNLVIPSSVISIGKESFKDCRNLINPVNNPALIPNSVKSIGAGAFLGCKKLTSMMLAGEVEKIGDNAFKDCIAIKRVNIPDSTTSIGTACFSGCTELESIHLPKTLSVIPDNMFLDCLALSNVNLSKDTLSSIGVSAFKNCDKLVTFNNTALVDFTGYKLLAKIQKSAFQDCDSIRAVSLSAATTTLGDYAFDDCNSLSGIDLGTGLNTIPTGAFSNLTSLKKMVVPRNVTVIKTGAFSKDPNFEEIHIPKTTLTIEPGAFSYCDHLTVYVVEDSPAHEFVKQQGIPFKLEVVYVDNIQFAQSPIKIDIGDKVTPVIDISPVNYSVDVTYKSEDETIFTVDENGMITGVAAGKANLVVRAPSDASGKIKTGTVIVEVRVPVTGVTLNYTAAKIGIGDTLQLEPTIAPAEASVKDVTWKSDNESVAYVDSKGVVYAKNKGTANITVTTVNKGKTAKCAVTVDSDIQDAPLEWTKEMGEVTADPGSGQVSRGTKIRLKAPVPGATIFYTTDGTTPIADFTGRTAGSTRVYNSPIDITKNTIISAFAICSGYKYSPNSSFVYNVGDGWGEIPVILQEKLFGGNSSKIPYGIWYAFLEDDRYYTASGATGLDKEYTGAEITFNDGVYVFNGTDRLVENRDYVLSYKNNVEAAVATADKAPTVTVKGKSYYSMVTDFGFSISKKNLKNAVLLSGSTMTVATDAPISTVKPIVMYKGKELKENSDYVLSYYNGSVAEANKVAPSTKASEGDYVVVASATANGNYTGSTSKTINIRVVDGASTTLVAMNSKDIKITVTDVDWTGSFVNVNKLFSDGLAKITYKTDTVLRYDADYTVEEIDTTAYPDYPGAGSYKFVIHGKPAAQGISYVGDTTATVNVKGIDASKVKVACLNPKPEYTGGALTIDDLYKADSSGYKAVTLYVSSDEVLALGTDYDVELPKAPVFGKCAVTFKLKRKYIGTIEKTVTVVACDISGTGKPIDVQAKPAVYCKAGAVPEVTVTYKDNILKENIDYTLSYKRNKNIKTAVGKEPMVTVKGKGCFKGSVSKKFEVVKAPVTDISLTVNDLKYVEGKTAKYYKKVPSIKDHGKTVSKGKDIVKLSKSDYKYYDYMTGKELSGDEVLPLGSMIEVRAAVTAASGSWYDGTATLSTVYRVVDQAKLINRAKVKVSGTIYSSGDNTISLRSSNLTVVLNGVTLTSSDYAIVEVTSSGDGKAKATLVGTGEYGGIKKISFKYKVQ